MPARLLVVTGPPGAGKTTVCALVAAALPTPCVHLRADAFWEHIATGYIAPWRPEAQRQNEAVMRAVGAVMASLWTDGYSVVVDGVIGPWFLALLADVHQPGMALDYVILRPALAEAERRVAGREGGLKDESAVAHMHAQFTAIEPPYDQHVIDNTHLTPQDAANAILAGRASASYRLWS